MTNEKINQLFYSQEIHDDKIFLVENEAQHCFRALRKQSGDIIDVVDGKGNFYKALIEREDIHNCQLKIIGCKKTGGIKTITSILL